MFFLTFTTEVFMRDPLYWAFEHLAVLKERQQAVLIRPGINIEDIAPAPPKVWSTPHIEEIVLRSNQHENR
jgi:hypothetical protein